MTTEDLMKPRYKVRANYPNSGLDVGEILHQYTFPETGNYTYVTNPDILLLGKSKRKEEVEIYPHLFRKLEWWEERKPEEMPEYVKASERGVKFVGNKVVKVHHYTGTELDHLRYECDGNTEPAHCSWVVPATESDYHQSLKTKP